MEIDSMGLSTQEVEEIKRLLLKSANTFPKLEDIWKLIDAVWDELCCNSKKLDLDKIRAFYNHPVWLLNGLFVEQHELSRQHRRAISNWIGLRKDEINSVLDYGGGFGTLARLAVENNNNLFVDIYEPHPSKLAIAKVEPYSSINFISSINRQYDCLVSTDVLEHVPDPLYLFAEMIESVRVGGYLVIANCFYPVIKCHLPTTFHLRYTFNQFAKIMGLEVLGLCEGSHATLFKKSSEKPFEWKQIRDLEKISKTLFLPLKIAHGGYKSLKKVLR